MEDLRKIYRSDGAVRPSVGTFCTEEEGRTKQEEARAADINFIVPQAARGLLPSVRSDGVFADVSELGDLRESLEMVKVAEREFMTQPAAVRSAFGNDMASFVEAFKSEEGVAKLRELKVLPETEETLSDRREAAAETRAERRRKARELAERVKAAESPPVDK